MHMKKIGALTRDLNSKLVEEAKLSESVSPFQYCVVK